PQRQSGTVDSSSFGRELTSLTIYNGQLWTAQNVGYDPPGSAPIVNAVRVLRIPTTLTGGVGSVQTKFGVVDPSLFHNEPSHYFYPAVTANKAGQQMLVFLYSRGDSGCCWVGIRYVKRVGGRWQKPSIRLMTGSGAFPDPNNRVGDYSWSAWDPADNSFWI